MKVCMHFRSGIWDKTAAYKDYTDLAGIETDAEIH